LGTHTKKDEGESRETGNIGHARKKTKAKKTTTKNNTEN
jgi:hypothetical protein